MDKSKHRAAHVFVSNLVNARPHLALLAIAVAALFATPASAQTSETFFKDKTVKVMVGHPPGGSFDFYARLAAEMLKAHLPGVANVIVENKPGGGGLLATAQFFAQAPRDGTMLAVFPETITNTQVFDPAMARWKVEEMSYVGSFAPVNNAFVRHGNAAFKTPDELRKRETNVGCSGVASQSYQFPAMLKALDGFNFKMICGYPGAAQFILALEKGEVDLVSNAWNTWRVTHTEQLKRGEFVPFIQVGIKRNRELPNVPLMQEVVRDAEAKQIVELASAGAAIGRSLLAPPGLAAERVAYLRAVFDKMVKDPAMIELAAKRNLDLEPTAGVELQAIVEKVLKTPKSLIEKTAAAMKG